MLLVTQALSDTQLGASNNQEKRIYGSSKTHTSYAILSGGITIECHKSNLYFLGIHTGRNKGSCVYKWRVGYGIPRHRESIV